MFSLMWTTRLPNRDDAEAPAARLSSMKMPLAELDEFCSQLGKLFAKRAEQTQRRPAAAYRYTRDGLDLATSDSPLTPPAGSPLA